MNRKILSISSICNRTDRSENALEGDVLSPEAQTPSPCNRIRRAIHALHEIGMRSGSPRVRALALNAALELRTISPLLPDSSRNIRKDYDNA